MFELKGLGFLQYCPNKIERLESQKLTQPPQKMLLVISVAYRLRGKPKTAENKNCPSIIVRFIFRKTGNTIYSSGKKLKSAEFNDLHTDRVLINENLTTRKKRLLFVAN